MVDKTTTVAGGSLVYLEILADDLRVALDPEPPALWAQALEATLSISRMFIDSGGGEGEDIEIPPEDEEPVYYGVPSRHFGLGGAPPYIDGYPVGGTMDFRVTVTVEPGVEEGLE